MGLKDGGEIRLYTRKREVSKNSYFFNAFLVARRRRQKFCHFLPFCTLFRRKPINQRKIFDSLLEKLNPVALQRAI